MTQPSEEIPAFGDYVMAASEQLKIISDMAYGIHTYMIQQGWPTAMAEAYAYECLTATSRLYFGSTHDHT